MRLNSFENERSFAPGAHMNGRPAHLHFSLAEVPEQSRLETLREVFGPSYANIDFVPLTESPQVEVDAHILPGVAVTRGFYTPHLLTFNHDSSRGSHDFTFVAGSRLKNSAPVSRSKVGRMTHRRQEIEGGDGSAFLISCAEPTIAETKSSFWPCAVTISRSMLLPLLPDAEDALMRVIPAENSALRLLNTYLETLGEGLATASPELAYAVACHIRDLVVLALGTGRDAAAAAAGGGLRAARLAAVKRWVFAHITKPDLCVTKAAASQGVSPRYVQMLFEAEGTTYSSYVLARRLDLAHRLLSDPKLAGRAIGDLAYSAGFNDLSYFNRAFRRTFHQSPSDVRHRAAVAGDEIDFV